jgi:carbon storage regulator
MLVLNRKPNEKIVVGEGPDEVTITILSIGRDRVRLGIEAPRTVPVDRQEVRDLKTGKANTTPPPGP